MSNLNQADSPDPRPAWMQQLDASLPWDEAKAKLARLYTMPLAQDAVDFAADAIVGGQDCYDAQDTVRRFGLTNAGKLAKYIALDWAHSLLNALDSDHELGPLKLGPDDRDDSA